MKRRSTKRRLIRTSWIIGLLVAGNFAASGQTSHSVDVTNNVYTPKEITINQGDTVIWTNSEGRHNVNGQQSVYPSNPESFGNDVGTGWVFSHVFTIPGVYDYQCDPHVQFGMVGTVTVLDSTATIHEVLVSNGTFTPQDITIMLGDVIKWRQIEGSHNVNGNQDTYPDNPASFGNGPAAPGDWLYYYQFTMPGKYDYQCDPHVQFGMVGKVTVMELLPDSLTINFSGMTPHLGQNGWLLVRDSDTGEEIERSAGIIEESFTLKVLGIIAGHNYTVDIFADHNGNGHYDAPPADHAWRYEIENIAADEVLEFTHNTDFTDIAWEHRAIVNLSGMTPHLDQDIHFALVDIETGEVIDRKSELVEESFSVGLGELMMGKSYYVDFYSDHNGNGSYDAPPTDHAWRLEIANAMGDDTIDFAHNTDFTDVSSSFGPDILLAEDAELGMILTDKMGFTLYYFTKDALPDTSLCTGGCVDNWPLFYVENPELGEGLEMEDFGVIEHPEGGMQSTYKGWPLYYWVNDVNPGETKGEAVGNVWFVAKPDYSIMLMDGLLIGKDGVTYNSIYEPGEEMVQYFVDEYGRTLFIFVNDSYDQNNFTDEDFGNNGVWPVYEEELQHVASTLDKSMFGSIDVFGHQQLTFKGWPLYYFGPDTLRGQTTGVSVPSPGIWPVAVNGLEDAPVLSSVDESALGTQLGLYPNPATDEIQLTSDQSIESVSIINILGANIRTIKGLREYNTVISLDGIDPGIYFLEVHTSDRQKLVRRFVKR